MANAIFACSMAVLCGGLFLVELALFMGWFQ